MSAIKVIGVNKTLERVQTLNNISMAIECREFAVILGPSGCGKSTLLNIMAGLLKPDQGRIELGGVDWTGKTGRVSYMQQKDLLLPWQNILDNVCIPLLLRGVKRKDAYATARGYLQDFGLEGFENYYPRQLSGGMRQRAALLRTYLFTSDIMLLDEPFATLDAITRHKMQEWLKELAAKYKPTVVLVTHDIEEALLLADVVYVLSARPAQVKFRAELAGTSLEEKNQLRQDILAFLETPQPVQEFTSSPRL
ncbi:MAG: ABC transporter ATP-binding protein [Syntrophomonadaceae bacterium]